MTAWLDDLALICSKHLPACDPEADAWMLAEAVFADDYFGLARGEKDAVALRSIAHLLAKVEGQIAGLSPAAQRALSRAAAQHLDPVERQRFQGGPLWVLRQSATCVARAASDAERATLDLPKAGNHKHKAAALADIARDLWLMRTGQEAPRSVTSEGGALPPFGLFLDAVLRTTKTHVTPRSALRALADLIPNSGEFPSQVGISTADRIT